MRNSIEFHLIMVEILIEDWKCVNHSTRNLIPSKEKSETKNRSPDGIANLDWCLELKNKRVQENTKLAPFGLFNLWIYKSSNGRNSKWSTKIRFENERTDRQCLRHGILQCLVIFHQDFWGRCPCTNHVAGQKWTPHLMASFVTSGHQCHSWKTANHVYPHVSDG